jgi:hypothetical protein
MHTELAKLRSLGSANRAREASRAEDGTSAVAEDVGVDRRRLQVPMAEQLLDRPDMVPLREQMGGEVVTDGVTSYRAGDPASSPLGV